MKKIKPAEFFWSIIFILGQIIIGLSDYWEYLAILHTFLSIGFLMVAMGHELDDYPVVFLLTPIAVFCGIIILVVIGGHWVFKHTILKFNTYLNNMPGTYYKSKNN